MRYIVLTKFQEGVTGEIDLPSDDPNIVAHLIQFLYTGDFNDQSTLEHVVQGSRMLACTKAYIMADKFNVPGLKTLAATKFTTAIATEWNTEGLSTAIELIYNQIPENDRILKDVVLKVISEHVKELVDRGEFASLCKADGEIAFDILCKHLTYEPEPEPSSGVCPWYGIAHYSWIRSSTMPMYKYRCSHCCSDFN